MSLTSGNAPATPQGTPAVLGYAPGYGPVPIQVGTPTADTTQGANNQLYGQQIVQIAAGQAVAPLDGQKATYAASVTGLALVASATDIFTITGSATKTIRVTRLRISGIKTGAGADIDVQLIVRSTADTSGTKTNPTLVPYDSASAAATAVVAAYTANPTLGTAVGTLAVDSVFIPLATASGGLLDYNFGNRPAQAVVLRGVAQQLCVNLNGVTVGGGAFDIWCEFSEE